MKKLIALAALSTFALAACKDNTQAQLEQQQKQIEFHFNHYKDLKKAGTTKVESWGDVEEAKQVIKESIERWNKQA